METPEKIKDFDKATTDEEKRFLAIRQTYEDRKKNNKFILKDLIEYYGYNYDKYFTYLRKLVVPEKTDYVNILELKRRRKAESENK